MDMTFWKKALGVTSVVLASSLVLAACSSQSSSKKSSGKEEVVFAKYGTDTVIGKGIVESDYIYDPNRSDGYVNIRKVRFQLELGL